MTVPSSTPPSVEPTGSDDSTPSPDALPKTLRRRLLTRGEIVVVRWIARMWVILMFLHTMFAIGLTWQNPHHLPPSTMDAAPRLLGPIAHVGAIGYWSNEVLLIVTVLWAWRMFAWLTAPLRPAQQQEVQEMAAASPTVRAVQQQIERFRRPMVRDDVWVIRAVVRREQRQAQQHP